MTTTIPQNKEELKQAVLVTYQKLTNDYYIIPDTLTRDCLIEGNIKNTLISVCDTLAYLVGWGKLVVKWYTLKSQGKPVDFPETGYKWNELGKLATHFHQQYYDWHYRDLLAEFEQVTHQLIKIIEQTSNEELYEKSWYEQWTLGRMIQLNTSSPMKNIRVKIRRFIKKAL